MSTSASQSKNFQKCKILVHIFQKAKSPFLLFLPQPVLGKLLRWPDEPWAPAFLAEHKAALQSNILDLNSRFVTLGFKVTLSFLCIC